MFNVDESWVPFINGIACVIVLLSVIRGYRRGLIRMVISLASLLVSVFVAWTFSPGLSTSNALWPKEWTPLQDTLFSSQIYDVFNHIAWFFLLFLACRILFAVLDKIFKGMQKIPVWKQIMSILGAVLGFGEGILWVMIFALILCTPLFTNGADAVDKSVIGSVQKENTVIQTVWKPFTDTEDVLRLANDVFKVAQEQQNLMNGFNGNGE